MVAFPNRHRPFALGRWNASSSPIAVTAWRLSHCLALSIYGSPTRRSGLSSSRIAQPRGTITPCLWFDGNAEEAAKFYASLFPNSHVDAVNRAPSDYPSGKAGDMLLVEFTLMGQPFTGLNGGPQFQFNEAISFQIPVETQAEADRFADALGASDGLALSYTAGPTESMRQEPASKGSCQQVRDGKLCPAPRAKRRWADPRFAPRHGIA
jgi:predicted 3-demethylubiquinone-9 3-methyltransferase (glyoxalase superfamily)